MSELPPFMRNLKLQQTVALAQKYHANIADMIQLLHDENQTFDSMTIRIAEEIELAKPFPLLNEFDSCKMMAISPLGVQVFHQAFDDDKTTDLLTQLRLLCSCQSEVLRLLIFNRWQLINNPRCQASIHTMTFAIAVLARGEQVILNGLFEAAREDVAAEIVPEDSLN